MNITRGRTAVYSSTLMADGVATAIGVSDDIRFIVKWRPSDDDTEIVFQCRIGDGVTLPGGTGQYLLTISSSKSSALPVSSARQVLYYELIYVKNGTDAYTLGAGPLYVNPAVLQNL